MNKITVSFSGGRTSAFMARWLQQNTDADIQYVFANTGCEHEKTLEFINRCDEAWKLGVVWVEAVVNPERGKGTRHKVVTYETASRNGEPFEDVIKKYGIPNMSGPNKCTRETKLSPMTSYRKETGFNKAQVAIGIRIDEIDRVNPNHKELNLLYPLVTMRPTTEEELKMWWREQPFDLEIEEHYGNCTWCWKKSMRKHLTLMKDTPEVFEFPERMEKLYSRAGVCGETEPQQFFRQNRTVQDIRELAQQPFTPFVPGLIQPDMFGHLDLANGCEESCEVY